jgi:hypothetical protein
MKANTINMLRYWRNSLVDGYRLQDLKYAVDIDQEALESGELNSETASKLRVLYREAANTRQDAGNDAETLDSGLPVLVCPIRMSARYGHYQERTSGDKEIIPLWIPALLDNDGRISPRQDHLPWITRNLLEPTTKPGMTIGDIKDIEEFLTRHDQDGIFDSWRNLMQFATDMLKAIPGAKDSLSDFLLQNQSYIMPDIEVRNAAWNAICTLDYLIADESAPSLLQRYASVFDMPEKPTLVPNEHLNVSIQHYGQMGRKFPLAPSQREALHHFLRTDDGEILAVNGPPGTGKTTLLHSIIATMWVKAALNKDWPPIIIAASANNQAVKNIIDSLEIVIGDDSMSMRWIPKVKSYGLYCPSDAAMQQSSEQYQHASPYGSRFPATNGFPGKVEDPAFVGSAGKYYLERVSEYAGKPISTVKEAVELLHQQLADNINDIKNELTGYQKLCETQEMAECYTQDLLRKYQLTPACDIIGTLISYRFICENNIPILNSRLLSTNLIVQDVEARHRDASKQLNAIPTKIGFMDVIAELVKPKKFKKRDALLSVISDCKKKIDTCKSQAVQIQCTLDKNKKQLAMLNIDIAKLKETYAAMQQTPEPIQSLYQRLDTENRHKSFLLATHYWEGRWLLETRKMQDLSNRKDYLEPTDRLIRKWRRYSMLTPVIVSTLYVAPALFTAKQDGRNYEPVLECADLLIIDEAGQSPPELAAATFALAKKAVVVGDILQIEPVYSVNRYVDQGNLIRHGIIKDRTEYAEAHTKGLTSSGGSVMAVCHRACQYWLSYEDGEKYPDRGMFLREHHRCLDGLIGFCNFLAYGGRLVPLRGNEIRPGGLPQFCYLDVQGRSVRAGSSRKNEREAIAILDWLLMNRQRILHTYGGESFKQIVAVLTPFTAQRKYFLRTLANEKYKSLRGITVGTIHALQGAERDVVIFSPVYTREDGDPGSFFFNRDIRMLNVAVSRAREAFAVIGDMQTFRNSKGPAGLLAQSLFAEANDLRLQTLMPGGSLLQIAGTGTDQLGCFATAE